MQPQDIRQHYGYTTKVYRKSGNHHSRQQAKHDINKEINILGEDIIYEDDFYYMWDQDKYFTY